MTDASLTLTASLRPAALDARRGIVRLHPEVFTALGVRDGSQVTVREAALAAMRESVEAAAVTADHVAAARERVRPSLDPAQVAWLASYAEQRAGR